MPNTFLLNNVSVSAPATSPVYTVPNGTSVFSYTLSITHPTSTTDQLEAYMEISLDGGSTWKAIVDVLANGGVQSAKSPTPGAPMTDTSNGSLDYLVPGNKLRARAVTVTGTWTFTAFCTTS